MPIPHGKYDSPGRYEPNPEDDRALKGEASTAYLALATAIEQLEEISQSREIWPTLNPKVRQPIRSAESSLRRAAYALVVYTK